MIARERSASGVRQPGSRHLLVILCLTPGYAEFNDILLPVLPKYMLNKNPVYLAFYLRNSLISITHENLPDHKAYIRFPTVLVPMARGDNR